MSEDLDLDAIKARVDATTPGPWSVGLSWDKKEKTNTVWSGGNSIALVYAHPGVSPSSRGSEAEGIGNKEFIAHAREDVPALVAEVERMHADLVEWKEVGAPRWVGRQEDEKRALQDEIDSLTTKLVAAQMAIGAVRRALPRGSGDMPDEHSGESEESLYDIHHLVYGADTSDLTQHDREMKAEGWVVGVNRVVNHNKAAQLVRPTDNPYDLPYEKGAKK